MGRRPDGSRGASACGCSGRTVAAVFVCACLLVLMAATDGGGAVRSGSSAAAAAGGAGGVDYTASSPSSPARRPAGDGGADAFRSSKRRIPKGPDPIHNRRAGKTTVAPRWRD